MRFYYFGLNYSPYVLHGYDLWCDSKKI